MEILYVKSDPTGKSVRKCAIALTTRPALWALVDALRGVQLATGAKIVAKFVTQGSTDATVRRHAASSVSMTAKWNDSVITCPANVYMAVSWVTSLQHVHQCATQESTAQTASKPVTNSARSPTHSQKENVVLLMGHVFMVVPAATMELHAHCRATEIHTVKTAKSPAVEGASLRIPPDISRATTRLVSA
ncbi:unnamed protein product [Candidula unifasciata]|uniref:Uncharacterized protein n=1 Tax=Candidula unifasciata TaxID=100452 RepID=A0A8S3Z6W2_9EUPU|nr:unnamed protein product [Candidula unifasciata]